MKQSYKNAWIAILLINTFLFGNVRALCADELGRLFTTVAERNMLESLRREKPLVFKIEDIEIEEIAIEEKPELGGITVNGLVYREHGNSTAWVNNSSTYQGDLNSQYFRVDEENIAPENIQIQISESSTKIILKAGQTYDPIADKIIDITDDYTE